MENYEIHETLGVGSFGTVYKGIRKNTKEIYAIKKFAAKFTSIEKCKELREIKALTKLDHPNIIKLRDIILEQNNLFLVFDIMSQNLIELLMKENELSSREKINHLKNPRESKGLNEDLVKYLMYQTLSAVSYMHKFGYFHRDLKPENILINEQLNVKLADFGLAREIRSIPPFTQYVSTRWYRAPECLLESYNYSFPVDIWALGCIIVELLSGNPLFPGSSQKDTLMKINSVLGAPIKGGEIDKLAKRLDYRFPSVSLVGRTPFEKLFPEGTSKGVIELAESMLKWEPLQRPTAASLLTSTYFFKYSGNEKQNHIFFKIKEDANINDKNLSSKRNYTLNNNNSQTYISQGEIDIDKLLESSTEMNNFFIRLGGEKENTQERAKSIEKEKDLNFISKNEHALSKRDTLEENKSSTKNFVSEEVFMKKKQNTENCGKFHSLANSNELDENDYIYENEYNSNSGEKYKIEDKYNTANCITNFDGTNTFSTVFEDKNKDIKRENNHIKLFYKEDIKKIQDTQHDLLLYDNQKGNIGLTGRENEKHNSIDPFKNNDNNNIKNKQTSNKVEELYLSRNSRNTALTRVITDDDTEFIRDMKQKLSRLTEKIEAGERRVHLSTGKDGLICGRKRRRNRINQLSSATNSVSPSIEKRTRKSPDVWRNKNTISKPKHGINSKDDFDGDLNNSDRNVISKQKVELKKFNNYEKERSKEFTDYITYNPHANNKIIINNKLTDKFYDNDNQNINNKAGASSLTISSNMMAPSSQNSVGDFILYSNTNDEPKFNYQNLFNEQNNSLRNSKEIFINRGAHDQKNDNIVKSFKKPLLPLAVKKISFERLPKNDGIGVVETIETQVSNRPISTITNKRRLNDNVINKLNHKITQINIKIPSTNNNQNIQNNIQTNQEFNNNIKIKIFNNNLKPVIKSKDPDKNTNSLNNINNIYLQANIGNNNTRAIKPILDRRRMINNTNSNINTIQNLTHNIVSYSSNPYSQINGIKHFQEQDIIKPALTQDPETPVFSNKKSRAYLILKPIHESKESIKISPRVVDGEWLCTDEERRIVYDGNTNELTRFNINSIKHNEIINDISNEDNNSKDRIQDNKRRREDKSELVYCYKKGEEERSKEDSKFMKRPLSFAHIPKPKLIITGNMNNVQNNINVYGDYNLRGRNTELSEEKINTPKNTNNEEKLNNVNSTSDVFIHQINSCENNLQTIKEREIGNSAIPLKNSTNIYNSNFPSKIQNANSSYNMSVPKRQNVDKVHSVEKKDSKENKFKNITQNPTITYQITVPNNNQNRNLLQNQQNMFPDITQDNKQIRKVNNNYNLYQKITIQKDREDVVNRKQDSKRVMENHPRAKYIHNHNGKGTQQPKNSYFNISMPYYNANNCNNLPQNSIGANINSNANMSELGNSYHQSGQSGTRGIKPIGKNRLGDIIEIREESSNYCGNSNFVRNHNNNFNVLNREREYKEYKDNNASGCKDVKGFNHLVQPQQNIDLKKNKEFKDIKDFKDYKYDGKDNKPASNVKASMFPDIRGGVKSGPYGSNELKGSKDHFDSNFDDIQNQLINDITSKIKINKKA